MIIEQLFKYAGRILGLGICVFFFTMSFDARSGIEFTVHNLPTLICILALSILWTHPRVGAVIYDLLGIGSIIFFHTFSSLLQFSVISLPFFVVSAFAIFQSALPSLRQHTPMPLTHDNSFDKNIPKQSS